MSQTNIQLSDISTENNPHVFRLEIGLSIRQIREGRGLTQEHLAARMSLSSSTISKIESGKSNFSIDYLSRVAEFLNFEIILK